MKIRKQLKTNYNQKAWKNKRSELNRNLTVSKVNPLFC